MTQTQSLPVLPLRDIVVFPQTVLPLYVGRSKSLKAIEKAEASTKHVFLVTQLESSVSDPDGHQLYKIGTIARLKQIAKLPDGNLKILVEGVKRATALNYSRKDNRSPLDAEVEDLRLPLVPVSEDLPRLMRTVVANYEAYLKANGKTVDDFARSLEAVEDPQKLVDLIATQSSFKLKDRQDLLEIAEPFQRLDKLAALLLNEIEILKLDRKIKNRVREQVEKSQRDYYLNEQLSAIHKELGNEGSDPKTEIAELEKKLKAKKMPDAARQRAEREIRKLKTSGHSAETSVIRNYVELILDLPWDEVSADQKDLSRAEKILNEDHYGLKEIKDRILEFLAVRNRVAQHKSPILCFVGPPGVGKTSLARSIARTLDRKFEKISLGGIRDEAELRGHRRTYIGALPGKVISAIRKAGVSNPVILLDEVDKVGSDWRGDPSSALLEILDPEQNKTFTDHYLDLDYDLSKVMFIATANLLDTIPAPLRDRMEVIRLSGYTEDEKTAIARGFIIPRSLENHGLTTHDVNLSDQGLQLIIRRYTREAGVRNLEREISKVFRKVVKRIELNPAEQKPFAITEENLETFLGASRFRDERFDQVDEVGIATGLAWTPTGGEVLHIEVACVPGKGKIQITGQLGEVMQESAKAAITYIRSRSKEFGIPDQYFSEHDIHIHVPEGAIQKDGPSAGITLTTAVLSAVLGRKVNRSLAMTGEVTLRGRVLPIGGLKEKILGAKRVGIHTVIYPLENQKDLREIEDNILSGMKLIPVFNVDEVLEAALGLRVRATAEESATLLRSEVAKGVGLDLPRDLSH